ncbi:MAG: LON peptidase substrate-binding domain-containing protein [Chloroflexota bacterium]
MAETERLLPLFPLGQVVLFPGMSLPLRIFEERYKLMIGACQVTDQVFGVLLIRSGGEVGAPAQPERVGCTARVVRVDRTPDGEIHIMSIGQQRFRLRGNPQLRLEGYLECQVRLLDDRLPTVIPPTLVAQVARELKTYEAALSKGRPGAPTAPEPPRDPLALSYRAASTLSIHPRERQFLLELDDVVERLERELTMLRRENRPAHLTIGPFSVN